MVELNDKRSHCSTIEDNLFKLKSDLSKIQDDLIIYKNKYEFAEDVIKSKSRLLIELELKVSEIQTDKISAEVKNSKLNEINYKLENDLALLKYVNCDVQSEVKRLSSIKNKYEQLKSEFDTLKLELAFTKNKTAEYKIKNSNLMENLAKSQINAEELSKKLEYF